MVKVNAVLMAGSGKDSRPDIHGEDKIFLPYKGKPLVKRVAEALVSTENVLETVAVGPKERLDTLLNGELTVVEQVGTFVENALVGHRAFRKPTEYTLYIFGDLPYATSEAIDYALNRVPENANVGIYLPVCPKERCNPAGIMYGPYMEVDGRRYRTANMGIVDVEKARSVAEVFEKAFRLRHFYAWDRESLGDVFRLLGELGFRSSFDIFSRFLSKKFFHFGDGLKLEHIRSALSERFGLEFEFIETPFVDTVLDVDAPRHARRLLERGGYLKI